MLDGRKFNRFFYDKTGIKRYEQYFLLLLREAPINRYKTPLKHRLIFIAVIIVYKSGLF